MQRRRKVQKDFRLLHFVAPYSYLFTYETCRSLDGLGVAFQVLMPEDSGSNPEAGSIYSFDEVCPGLGLLQPQWNPYPTLPRLLAECVTSVQSVALSMVWQSVTTHGEVAGDLSSRTQLESDVNTVGLSFQ